jgi:outer membrane protein assembly factor BamE (lipoprotein component of BamABCDE complex)
VSAIRVALAAIFALAATGEAQAFDPAKLETIPLGISRADARKILGEADTSIANSYPAVIYKLAYNYRAPQGPAGGPALEEQATLIFDYDDKLSVIQFAPSGPTTAQSFDPVEIDALALGTAESKVKALLGVPSQVTRNTVRDELVYRYHDGIAPDEARKATLFFYHHETPSQLIYATARRPDNPPFDAARLADIKLGIAEADAKKLLGVPDAVERSSTFDTLTYYYAIASRTNGGAEKRKVDLYFWSSPNLTSIDYSFDGAPQFRGDFDSAKIENLKQGLSQSEVRSLLGPPDTESRSTSEADFTYNYSVLKPETRIASLAFGANGKLAGISIDKTPANAAAVIQSNFDPAALERLVPGISRAQAVALLGRPSAETRDGPSVKLAYSYVVLRPENRTQYLKFGADGKLMRFSGNAKPATGGLGEALAGLKTLSPGAAQSEVKGLLGDPDTERHNADGTIEFDYAYSLPYGPDGGGGGSLTAALYFTADGRFAKAIYGGDGAGRLELSTP